MKRWQVYHEMVGNRPNSLVSGALDDFHISRGSALDLGAGNLRDSKYLLGQGFSRVVAVDHSEESLAYATKGIELHISPIELYQPEKENFDFVVSCNTLFFLDHPQITQVLKNVLEGLRSGGIFSFNVLGKEDDWVKEGATVSSFTEAELLTLCEGYEIVADGESKNNSVAVSNGVVVPKFWHQFSVVLQKH